MRLEGFGGAFGDEAAAEGTGAGAEIEDVIGAADHVEVVFDDDEGVAAVDELVEDAEEFDDVVAMKADSGFVEEIEGFAGGAS